MKMMNLSTDILKDHYGHLASKPFFPEIVSYMQLSPVIAMILE
jgi:nucleoside-diphosphate kinase